MIFIQIPFSWADAPLAGRGHYFYYIFIQTVSLRRTTICRDAAKWTTTTMLLAPLFVLQRRNKYTQHNNYSYTHFLLTAFQYIHNINNLIRSVCMNKYCAECICRCFLNISLVLCSSKCKPWCWMDFFYKKYLKRDFYFCKKFWCLTLACKKQVESFVSWFLNASQWHREYHFHAKKKWKLLTPTKVKNFQCEN